MLYLCIYIVHTKSNQGVIMLKKLVKYGNSNALILDKALLELLNIPEGAVVKIKTDGASLIITPHTVAPQESITKTVTPQETLQEAITQAMEEKCSNAADLPAYVSELNKVFEQYPKGRESMDQEVQMISQKYASPEYQYSDNENKGKLARAMDSFKKVHKKYQHIAHATASLSENANYINESVLLAEKYQATKNSPEYIQELTQLIAKHVPEYADYQNEIRAVGESLQ
jgi:antitoxin component of MazEF toxin-antitoxin module